MTKQELKDYLYDELDFRCLAEVVYCLGISADRLDWPVHAGVGITSAVIDIIAEHDYHKVLSIIKHEFGYEPS